MRSNPAGSSSIEALLLDLSTRGIRLWADGDNLGFEAPAGAFTPDLKQRVREAKADLLAHFSAEATAPLLQELSPAQEAIWLARLDRPDDVAYTIIFPIALPPVGEEVVKEAVQYIIDRHEALRTVFTEKDGRTFQRVLPTGAPVLLVHDIVDAENPKATAEQIFIREAARPFDLRNGPLVRFHLAHLGADGDHLVLAVDHLILDGMSCAVLSSEVRAAVSALHNGRRPDLPAIAVSPGQLAHRRLAALDERRNAILDDFWGPRIARLSTCEELPRDGMADGAVDGRRLVVELSAETQAALRKLGARSTVNTLCCSFVAALLGRYKNSGLVSLGVPFSGRIEADSSSVVGCFASVMPVIVDALSAPTFGRLAEAVSEEVSAVMDHQDVPNARLHRMAMAAAAPALIDAAVVVEEAASVAFTYETSSVGAGKFPLLFTFERSAGTVGKLCIEYDAGQFGRRRIERMAGHLERLIQAAVEQAETSIAKLPILTEDEEAELRRFNDTARPYPEDRSIADLFREVAHRQADRPALVTDEAVVTYNELDRRSDMAAQRLIAEGIATGEVVGLATGRGPEAVIAELAILKAGAVYMPIDGSMPADAVRRLMATAGATRIIADATARRRLDGLQAAFVDIGGDDPVPPPRLDGIARGGDDPAYVMFTSGTTGEPKGVLVPHRAIARLVINTDYVALTPHDTVAQAAPLGFDAATFEVWAPLLAGARLAFIDDETLFDPAALRDALLRHSVNVMWLTATLFNRVADEQPAAFRSLRQLISGGEALSPTHVARVMTACPDLRLVNGYGPTENTTFTTTHPIGRGDLGASSIPIGRPIANSRALVLGRGGMPQPIGVWGELHAGGDGLALGYVGRPDLTERAFPEIDGERFYRTGDVVRWTEGGVLEFGGRRDDQVKIRGHRIEIGAIEAVLSALPGVRDAAVLAVGEGDRRNLVAFVASGETDIERWRAAVRDRLPDYMLPGRFVTVEVLPASANGKKDRKALLALVAEQETPSDGRAAATDSERLVARLFGELFPDTVIDAEADFFRLGGHSLLAMRLAARVEQETGVRPKIQDLVAARTVERIAELVEASTAGSLPLPRAEGPDFPLSSGQARLWVLQRLYPDAAVYNVCGALDLEGQLDVPALERALTALEDRHHALRLRIVRRPDDPVGACQRLVPAGDLRLLQTDLGGEPDPVTAADTLAAADASIAFCLEDEPPVRARLITLGPSRWRLVVSIHHSACDGWSMPILLRDLGSLYARELGRPALRLPALSRHYEDFAAWQRGFVESDEGRALIARRAAELTPPPEPLALPTDGRRPATQRFHGRFATYTLPAQTTQRLDEFAACENATPFMVALALLQALFQRYTGQTDFALGTLVAGRGRSETVDLVGFFVNTLVLRARLDPGLGFRDLLATTRRDCLAAMADQDCPFEALVDAVAPVRDRGRNPLFDVMATWQDGAPGVPELPGVSVGLVDVSFPFAKFDLAFHFQRSEDAIRLQVEHDADLFLPETIDDLYRRLLVVADAVLCDAARPLGDLRLLDDEERRRVIEGFNDTDHPLPVRRTIPEPFLDMVAAAPGASAVLFDQGSFDYAGFAGRAAATAKRLREEGVRPGDVVAICAKRSPDLLVGIHGILMAGAAYAPLDPDHPRQRRDDMLADLGAPLVLGSAELAPLFAGGRFVALGCDQASAPVDATASPDDVAYVIFTSGSTGRPKGAAIEHHAVLNRILWMQSAFPIGPGDVILQKTPVTFDVSVWELFWWSWTGAAVALPPPGVEKNPEELVATVERFGVTVMHFVPSMLAAFLGWLDGHPEEVGRLRRLRYVFASGEALDVAQVERFNRLLHATHGTELHNLYGPTEATVDVTWQPCSPWTDGEVVPIGRPIANTRIYVLDPEGDPAPVGLAGEICIGGAQVARGYVNRPELTAERFLPDPFRAGGRIYRTGDLGRWRHDGSIEYLGRLDQQVKVRGFRIECGEIEHALECHSAVERAVVVPERVGGLTELHAYVVATRRPDVADLGAHLSRSLPDYMIPARFFQLEKLPLTTSGKVDRKALSGKPLDEPAEAVVTSPVEEAVAAIWRGLLPDRGFGPADGFFNVGGNSLLVIRLHEQLDQRWPGVFSIADLFGEATIAAQARRIAASKEAVTVRQTGATAGPIAIIGMATRLADHEDLDSFWRDVAGAADRVARLSPERAEDARRLFELMGREAPSEFREAGYLNDIFAFEPGRFRMSPMDAALLDPEQRLFLDTASRALDDAGYGGAALHGRRVGVFVGGAPSTVYRDAMLGLLPERSEQIFILNVPSNIATRLAFLNDWRGPAMVVDTACSSGLTAVHLACRALAEGECEAALVGAAKLLPVPPEAGSRMAIDSSTARTRAFASDADGTGMGEGAVTLLLKPLTRALEDGDAIHAVILGSAVNQDGASSGLSAPNPAAQAEAIRTAAEAADISLATLSYVEAHGTGTVLGDPIEIAGLTSAFADHTAEVGFAAIGSVKGNYGHLDAAAGILGLAKAVLCLRHDTAPPQPFFDAPNPKIDFAHAPVVVPKTIMPLADRGTPRRAGVSSFGLSGINAHVILEVPPSKSPSLIGGHFAIALSCSDAGRLRPAAETLASCLRRDRPAIADVARTLAEGRAHLRHRFAFVATTLDEAIAALTDFAITGRGALADIAPTLGRRPGLEKAVAGTRVEAQRAVAAYLAGTDLVWPSDMPAGRVHLPPTPFHRVPCRPDFGAVRPRTLGAKGPLGRPVATRDGWLIPVDFGNPGYWPVADHLLNGRPTLVGMALPGLALDAARALGLGGELEVRALRWRRPVRPDEIVPDGCGLDIRADGDGWMLSLGARVSPGGDWALLAEARLSPRQTMVGRIDLAELRAACPVSVPVAPFSPEQGAIRISDRWNRRMACWQSADGDELLAELKGGSEWDPALLDVAAGVALDGLARVPVGAGAIRFFAPPSPRLLVHARRRIGRDNTLSAGIVLIDPDDGRVLAELGDLEFAALNNRLRDPVSIPAWVSHPLADPPQATPILLLGDGPLADRLADGLAKSGRLAGRNDAAVDAGLVLLAPDLSDDPFRRSIAALRALSANLRGPLRVIAVGEGAHARAGETTRPDAALLAGACLAFAHEEPLISLRYVDLDERVSALAVAAEFEVFAPRDVIPLVVTLRGDERFVRRLAPLPDGTDKPRWPESGVCVVSGGLGGLALSLAEEMSAGGQVALALLSRSGDIDGESEEAARRRALLAGLAERGIRHRIYACDVANRAALSTCLASIRAELGSITAVVHAAGIADGGFLATRPDADMAAVLAPKLDGARHLEDLTRRDPVEAFVLFGSITGLVGAPGQVAYAAANAWTDAFAAQCRAGGRPALAIDWCRLAEVGMGARSKLSASAETTITPATAVAVWRRALTSDAPQVVVVDPSFDTQAAAQPQRKAEAPAQTKPAGDALETALASIWADVLGYPSLTPTDDFYALGGDSISGMQIVERIVRELGLAATLPDILGAATVGNLAKALRGSKSEAPTDAAEASDYPVGFEQIGVLNAEAAADMGTAYNLPNLVRLPDDLDVPTIETAVTALIARHDILRSRFLRSGDDWRMEVLPAGPVQLPRIDLTDEVDPFDACRRRVTRFDLMNTPPVRLELVRARGWQALFIDIHHALADGLSIELLAGDLLRLLRGDDLPPLARQLKDFTRWSRDGAGSRKREDARRYWLDRFQAPLPLIDLPADRRRPPVQTFRGSISSFELSPVTAAALRAFASQQRVTPFTVTLTAWMILIHRMANTADVVISVPADRRDDGGFYGTPGMMATLLPLRETLARDMPVGALLERVHADHADALRHRAYGLGQLLADLAPPATPDRTLLSEVTLSYMNFAQGSGDGAPTIWGLARDACKNDLAIFVRDLPTAISLTIEYYADLFDAERMGRLGRSFTVLVEALVSLPPDTPIGRLPLLPAEELERILSFEEGAVPELPSGVGLYDLFRRQVDLRPDAGAVADAEGELSYATLFRRANGLARALVSAGVVPGDRVAIQAGRDANLVVAVLGVIACGAIYVPLDPEHPPARLALITTDAGCRLAVVDATSGPVLHELGIGVLDVEETRHLDADEPPDIARPADAGSQPVYLMYTSGSTGLPKGVLVPARAVIRLAIGDDYAELRPGDNVLQAGSLAFDASTFEIWGALLNGGRVCVASRDDQLDPARMAEAIRRFDIDALFLTASLFNRLVEHDPSATSGVRAFLSGGEAMSMPHIRLAFEAASEVQFYNAYGPTENTTFTSVHRVRREDLDASSMPIGRPLPNSSVRILDVSGNRVPIGVWGELHAGGDGLAIGYWNRPELTAKAFVEPAEEPGTVLYRTGDLARWRADGVIEFGGRADAQVKIRGFRIELDEIEQVLQACPGVMPAAVAFRQDGASEGHLIACLTERRDRLPLADIRAWLAGRLPSYMIPAFWYELSDLPLNSNGKTDRQKLLALIGDLSPLSARGGGDIEPPKGGAEALVADILSEVLGQPVNDRRTSFLDLGGHSLQAIRIVNRLAEQTGVRPKMADFFADPTVAGLARLVEGGRSEDVIPAAPVLDVYPASHAQQRLFLLDGMDRGSAAYNIAFVFRCRGDLDVTAFKRALGALVNRHEPLRTGFDTIGGEIVQRIAVVVEPYVAVDDLRQAADPVSEAVTRARRDIATRFDLHEPPLLRARLVRLTDDDVVVLLLLHHIVGDGWSSRLLARELSAFYAAARTGRNEALPPLPITYKDFAVWQRGRDWSAAASFWRSRLDDAPDRIALPSERPLSDTQSYRGGTSRLTVPEATLAALHRFALDRRVTMAAVGLGLFAALLYRLTRQNDLVIGMGVAGRDRRELEGLIGFFVNVLPLRLHLDEDTEVTELVDAAHGAILEAMEHRDYPFDLLVRDVAPQRRSNRQPLVNVVFEYQRFDALADKVADGLPLRPAEATPDRLDEELAPLIDAASAKHDLILYWQESGARGELVMEYDTDIIDAGTADRWLGYLLRFSEAVAAE
ncbi:non-ribosomal peptide synthetase [Pleomorphomonas sp. NRK KF1]|uniref:non-ribosomal peptide synthetase n=1 Tax=Pleomorphomonas sp. NRK KF1 TaxID=2943000 RepID=UPI00204383C4|nr:non-ribosomal peptide synthetase [Pleomorphomonas sp. NRK KF1]MCM5553309.1 amino acid adenylation domain-containing protein [Pleomorphomonas sp. NRK KF1]